MKIFIAKILVLFTFIALCVEDAYGANQSVVAPKPGNNSVVFETVVVSSEQDNKLALTPQFSFSSVDKEDYSFFTYSLDDESKDLLKNPRTFDLLKFHDKVLVFEDSAKLPLLNPLSLTVYTCKDSTPVLVSVNGLRGWAPFRLNAETGRWSNCTLCTLNEFGKASSDGLTLYKNGLPNDYQPFFDELSSQCSEVSKGLTNDDWQVESPTLEVYLLDHGSERRKLEKREVNLTRVQPTGEEFKGVAFNPSLKKKKLGKVQFAEQEQEQSKPVPPVPVLESGAKKEEEPVSAPVEVKVESTEQESEPEQVQLTESQLLQSNPESKPAVEESQEPTPTEENQPEEAGADSQLDSVVELKISDPPSRMQKTKFTTFFYRVGPEDKLKIADSNTIEKINFNGVELIFMEPVNLPDRNRCESIDIFLCEHNSPFLVRLLLTGDVHYYYLWNHDTKKIKNTGLGKTSYVQKTDEETKATYYVPPQSDSTVRYVGDGIDSLFKNIAKKFCEGHQKTTETLKVPTIKLYPIALSALQQTPENTKAK